MNKAVFVIIGVLVAVGTALIYAGSYNAKYAIPASMLEIEQAVEAHSGLDIIVRDFVVTDDKLHCVFTIGEHGHVGSGELVRGWNRKYAIGFYGYGTNGIRQRVVETDQGQYLKLAGRNGGQIGSVEAYIGHDSYKVAIPDGEFYLVVTPVAETEQELTTAMIVYDRAGGELDRIGK